MISSLPVEKLRVGMYVILPVSWFKHSFLKNQFLITSEEQIKKIRDSELTEIKIDTSQGLQYRK